MSRLPELPIDPPEEHYVTADCGHECYEGEALIEWEGKIICEDCFMDKVHEMTVEELSALFGCGIVRVSKTI